MKRLRLWILLTAGGCFGSGVVIGYLAPDVVAGWSAGASESDPDEIQIDKMVEDFDLSPEQERVLRMIFHVRQENEMAVLRGSELEQLPLAVRSQIKTERNKAEQRIRMVLNPEQRRKYDQMSYGSR